MGLRERKAAQTRDHIRDAAMTLFERQGYDQTTMEQIAAAAEVGVATLYRYFATKDLILLGPALDSVSLMADYLAARPAGEPLDEALGHALAWLLTESDIRAAETERLRAQLDRASGPRAKLWDLWAQHRSLLENAIAERAGVEPTELWVGVTARITMMIAETALDLRRSSLGGRTAGEYAREVISLVDSGAAVMPQFPTGR
jgi:AcrR family transcriptional regulator